MISCMVCVHESVYLYVCNRFNMHIASKHSLCLCLRKREKAIAHTYNTMWRVGIKMTTRWMILRLKKFKIRRHFLPQDSVQQKWKLTSWFWVNVSFPLLSLTYDMSKFARKHNEDKIDLDSMFDCILCFIPTVFRFNISWAIPVKSLSSKFLSGNFHYRLL